MNSLKITIQRKVGEQWPIVLEQKATDTSLEIRTDGLLTLDIQALSSQITSRDYGTMLGQALFQGEVRDAFLHARAQSEDRLSVQLFVEAPDLRALRWERLCAPLDDRWRFLVLNQRTPLSLALPSKADRRFPPIRPENLRALVVVASPQDVQQYGLSPFDVAATVTSIRSALGKIPCDVLANIPNAVGPPTLDMLCERLTTTSYTLLHVVCHGKYLPDLDDTVVYLSKENQEVDPVVGSRLLDRLSQLRGERGLPHFAFLATCESASPQAEGALGGLAQRLVHDLGLPAVLAMTDTISISTAQTLASKFYQRLSAHGYLDVALAEACAGLAERPDSIVPALYSRLGAQPLFEEGEPSPAKARTPEQKNRRVMIDRVRSIWITGLLDQSLQQTTPIHLQLEIQPDLVENSWQLTVQELHQAAHLLPQGTTILDVYDQAQGELLILGEPGAGKTMLLLELARDLLDRAYQDETFPIPVVFNLSTWAKARQPLADWLIEELRGKYQIPRLLATTWIKTDQVLPLLDGLDEVIAEQQTGCVGAINTYRQEHGLLPTVVCSRRADYQALSTRLQLRTAVVVQPLTPQQIESYLTSGSEQLEGLREVLHKDANLQTLASTPLMLNVLTVAYQRMPHEEIVTTGSLETKREQVFALYVQRVLARRSVVTRYTAERTLHWLCRLAQQMKHQGQAVFYIEQMQPDWLSDEQRRARYRHSVQWVVVLLIELLVGLPCAVSVIWVGLHFHFSLAEQIILQAVVQFVLLLNLGISVTLQLRRGNRLTHITLKEKYSWSWIGRKRFLLSWLGGALICGPLFGEMFGAAFNSWDMGWAVGLFTALIFVPVSVLSSGWLPRQLDTHTRLTPNQGVWRSGRSGLIFGLLGSPIGGIVCVVLIYAYTHTYLEPWWGLFFGSFVGGIIVILFTGFGFGSGLDTFLEHFLLRFWLWQEKALPWNYSRFLDYVAERILLRKVGGGYIFLHRLLLDYFATLEAESSPKK